MDTDAKQYIEIRLDSERFGIHISAVHEIIRMQVITAIPNVRAHVDGVINLRGVIVPVFNLRSRLNMSEKAEGKTARIVVVNHSEEKIGLLVDAASHVISLTKLHPVPESLGELNVVLSGIGHTPDGLISILNLEAVLSS